MSKKRNPRLIKPNKVELLIIFNW